MCPIEYRSYEFACIVLYAYMVFYWLILGLARQAQPSIELGGDWFVNIEDFKFLFCRVLTEPSPEYVSRYYPYRKISVNSVRHSYPYPELV